MIKNKYVYSVFALLICLFIAIVTIFPKLNIEQKNSTTSYVTNIFNEKKVTTVNIEVDEDEWKELQENASEEEYIKGAITIGGKTVRNVAIRPKGNLSLRSVVNSDSDRYSLKIDFDYYDDTQSLYGLKKLNLNNNYSDTTLMREFVSYEMMEQMGLATPAHSYMYVTVNGEDYGLFLGIEQVDETFLARTYNDTSGYLYKPDGTGSDLKWISENLEDYTGMNLKTNEKDEEDSKLIDFLREINSEDGNLESVMDVDAMLRYFAMNTALVSLDSYQGTMKHNYYLYESDGKYSIIPWDYNMSFGGFGVGMGGGGQGGGFPFNDLDTADREQTNANDAAQNQPQRPGNGDFDFSNMPNMNNGEASDEDRSNTFPENMGGGDLMNMGGDLMSEDNINFSITTPVSGTTLEERPLLNALLAVDEYREQYEAYLEQIATTIFTEENVQAITNELATILTTYVEADPTKFSTTEQFLEGVSGASSLAAFAAARSESILKQLSGELIVEAATTTQSQNGTVPNTNGAESNEHNDSTNTEQNAQATPPTNGQGGFDPSNMPNGAQGGFDPSNMPNGGQGGFDPSNMPNGGQGRFDSSNMPNGGAETSAEEEPSNIVPNEASGEDAPNFGNFDPSNMPNGGPNNGMPGFANSSEESNGFVWTKNEIILAIVSSIFLCVAFIFVFKFKRRKG